MNEITITALEGSDIPSQPHYMVWDGPMLPEYRHLGQMARLPVKAGEWHGDHQYRVEITSHSFLTANQLRAIADHLDRLNEKHGTALPPEPPIDEWMDKHST